MKQNLKSLSDSASKLKNPLNKRLLPLYVAAFFQGFSFFYPVEKLFMSEIGFDAASIGIMAAVSAVLVPLVEAPSGILADRWSRKNVLIIASVALMLMALVGGFSNNVPTYIAATLFLSVFLAMYSGTYDAVVYDTVLEGTGDSDEFEKHIGRVRFFFSLAVVIASLAGGVLATLFAPRFTYFATIPCVAISIFALLKFNEPQLQESQERVSIKSQVTQTYKILLQQGKLLPIVMILVTASLLMEVIIEFNQLWLIALNTPLMLYGPAGAAILAANGFGGLFAGRVPLDKRIILALAIMLLIASSLVLIFIKNAVVVTAAQVIIAALIMVITVVCTRLMHDQIPSSVRTGVASGVGAFTWMAIVPFSLIFGAIGKRYGIFNAGWMILPVVVGICALLIKLFHRKRITMPQANKS